MTKPSSPFVKAHNLNDLSVSTPVYSDDELEHYSAIYTSNAKINRRMNFFEFIVIADAVLAVVDSWPDTVWVIEFTQVGDHEKLWIVDHISERTLFVDHIKNNRPEYVPTLLTQVGVKTGKPDYVVIDSPISFNAAAARAWCRHNDIDVGNDHGSHIFSSLQALCGNPQEAA